MPRTARRRFSPQLKEVSPVKFRSLSIVLSAALVAVTAAGCATKKYVKEETGAVNTRVDQVQGQVEQTQTTLKDHEQRIAGQDQRISATDQKVGEVSKKLKTDNKGVYVEVQGHTDNVGSAKYNQELGESRAEAVRLYLNEKQGLPLHRMNVISYGKTAPVADNKTRQGRAKNRRVVLVVLQ